MPSLENRPTYQDMLDWRDSLNGEWGELDTEQAQEEDLYFQRFDIESPHGRMGVKTGSAPADADAAIDTIVPADILVRVRPLRAREKYREQADKLVRVGKALLHAWRRRKDVLRQIASDMVIRRYGVARVLFDDTLWPPIPEGLDDEELLAWQARNRRKCPIVLERRNPRHVRWRESEQGDLLVVVEHYVTTALEAKEALGHYPAVMKVLRGRDANEKVTVSDVWYGAYRGLFIEDEPVFPVGGSGRYRGVAPHGYPEVPYAMAAFRELPFEEVVRRFRGMLTNAAGLYPIESQVLTMQVWLLAWNAWRTWKGHTIDGRDLVIVPGEYIPLDPRKGEYLEMLEGKPVPDELLQTAAVVDSYIQRNGVAQGPRTAEGTRSGQQLWAIQAMRQLKIESAKEELIRFVQRCLSLALMIIEERIDELTLPVPGRDREGKELGEVTVRPKDIAGYYDGYEISFGRRLDPALLEQAKALQALALNNWMPLRVSWEMSGLVDVPQEWEDDLLLQATDRLDFMLELLALERVRQEYGEESWQYKALRDRMMAGGPAQAMPGAPGMAAGGTIQPPSMRGPTAPPPLAAGVLPRRESRVSGRVRGPRLPGGGTVQGGPPPEM